MPTRSTDSLLPALLEALLPGNFDWPSAAETHVAPFMAGRASALPDVARALAAVAGVLPADFAVRDLDARASALLDAEARLPEAFALIVTEAYRGYYTDARVLALIERKTHYPARPPQPLGRAVRAADWSDLQARAIETLGESHDS